MCALVTGVQTCALPIWLRRGGSPRRAVERPALRARSGADLRDQQPRVRGPGPSCKGGRRFPVRLCLLVQRLRRRRRRGGGRNRDPQSADRLCPLQGAGRGGGGGAGGRRLLSDLPAQRDGLRRLPRSEEHTSELQSLMRISYAVFCLKKKKTN